MSRFKYPVDTDQFQRIREDGKVYVDKTGMMYSLVNKYQYVFLARPRRFGKSFEGDIASHGLHEFAA